MALILHDLEDAQASAEGCSLCYLEAYQVRRYLEGVANDGVNNIPLRQKLERRGGYCKPHSVQFAEIASPLSAAILLESFAKQRLGRAAKGQAPQRIDCEACEVVTNTHKGLLKSIKRNRRLPELEQALLAARLCIAHAGDVSTFMSEVFRHRLKSQFNQDLGHLAELIRKHDYRFNHEKVSEEEKQSIAQLLKRL